MYNQPTAYNPYQGQPQQYTPEQIQYQFNSMIQPLNQQMQMIGSQIEEIKYRFQSAYPQYFQQPPQQQIQQQSTQQPQNQEVYSIMPVFSYNEAENKPAPLVGKLVCTNLKEGEIYVNYLDNDSNKIVDCYALTDKKPQKISQDSQESFATIDDIKTLFGYISDLNAKIDYLAGGKPDEPRATTSTYTEQSANGSNVPKTAKQPKSNARPTNDGTTEQ